jgi:hypothetical protein
MRKHIAEPAARKEHIFGVLWKCKKCGDWYWPGDKKKRKLDKGYCIECLPKKIGG